MLSIQLCKQLGICNYYVTNFENLIKQLKK